MCRRSRSSSGAGLVFVSINHRLLPEVEMGPLIGDVAKAFGWMQKHIAEYGGDPTRVLVGAFLRCATGNADLHG